MQCRHVACPIYKIDSTMDHETFIHSLLWPLEGYLVYNVSNIGPTKYRANPLGLQFRCDA